MLGKILWLPINLLQAAYLGVWSIGWILAALVVRLIARSPEPALATARKFWAPGLLWGGLIRLEVRGLDKVDFSQPAFFVMNHRSQVDIVVAFHALPVNLRFIVKSELRRVPVLGRYIAAMGMIFVDRGHRLRALDSVAVATRLLRRGHSLFAFPEGRRSRDGRILPFKTGVLLPAIAAGVPVVPMALEGADRVLPPDGFAPRPGTLRVAIGEPLATTDLEARDRREFAKRVRQQVVALHEELVAEVRQR
nr:uncharacterized protein LOC133592343 [Nerophis lumbriciformis]